VDISPDGDDPERDDYRVVVLKDRLAEAVARLNPDLPQFAVDDVVHVVANPDHPSLEQNNPAQHRLYTNGVKVEYNTDDGKETIFAQIIDFQNPDNNDLLAYKVALVISDGITARVGSQTANKERFMPWNTIKNEDDRSLLENQLEKVVRGFFDPELFLDYMRYFVLFEDDGDSFIKKIAGYHQFHGVREAVRVTTIAAADSDDGEVRERRYCKILDGLGTRIGTGLH
jgi:type I restriction enzyme R subunit